LLDLSKELRRKTNLQIMNLTRVQAGEMAVGISPVAIKAATGTVQTLNHASRLERLQILVNRRMADIPAKIIEFFEDIPRAEMIFFGP
jgi:hypothetical protein